MNAAAYNRDEEHLNLLSLFHYIFAAICALFACVPFIHVAIGIIFIIAGAEGGKHAPSVVVGVVFVLIGGFIILLGWTFALCLFLSGRYLKRRRGYVFSFVIACFSCISFPYGTVLGVFTIIVLMRPSVKELYGGRYLEPECGGESPGK